MPRGYDRPLYILPFDHRASFQSRVFGWKSPLTPAQTAAIAAATGVISEGFKAALAAGLSREKAAILTDEQFGAAVLHDATVEGITTACCAEKSGQDEFAFEYGELFAEHIERIRPTFCKVLVRYNPEGDAALNKRQAVRLKRLSEYLLERNRSKFMFELLVPAEKSQLEALKGDKAAYDRELRPRLMLRSIAELQDAGVEPDIWKIEGLDRREDCEKMVAAARAGGRDHVSCITLGRGEDTERVRAWLVTAASVPGFIGLAVGRTVWWDSIAEWHAGNTMRDAAVAEIARRYCELVKLFETTAQSHAARMAAH